MIETPEGSGVIPSIIEDERVELYAAFFGELGAEGMYAVESVGFGVTVLVADVVPAVVIQEGRVRARSLVFYLREKSAAQLARRVSADHGGVRDGLVGL